MPDYSAKYQTYFKAENFKEGPRTLTIKSAALEKPSRESDEERVVLYFEEDERGLVLNKTRYDELSEIFGSHNTDKFVGGKIDLYYDPNIKFGGKKVAGIAVRAAA